MREERRRNGENNDSSSSDDEDEDDEERAPLAIEAPPEKDDFPVSRDKERVSKDMVTEAMKAGR